jgi:hypothetical protein
MALLPFIPDYTITDDAKRAYVSTNFSRQYSLGQNADVRTPEIRSDLDAWSFPGHTKDQLAQIENVFNTSRQQYMKETGDMKMLNNLANVSAYVSGSVVKEYDRLSYLRERSFSNVHKMRQHYMLKQYDVYYTRFQSGVIQFSLFVACVCGFILMYTLKEENPMSNTVAFSIIASMVAFYLLVLIVFIKDMLTRRKDDWNKFYFASMDSDKSGSCGKY